MPLRVSRYATWVSRYAVKGELVCRKRGAAMPSDREGGHLSVLDLHIYQSVILTIDLIYNVFS